MNLIQPIWQSPGLGGSTSMLGRLDDFSATPWLVVALVVVLFGTVVPFFLQMVALRHLPATIVTVVAMLEPVIANVLGWAWFRESLTPVQVLGARRRARRHRAGADGAPDGDLPPCHRNSAVRQSRSATIGPCPSL